MRSKLRNRAWVVTGALLGVAIMVAGLSGAGASVTSRAASGTYGGSLNVVLATGPWVSLDPNNPVEPPATANQFPWVESLFVPSPTGQPEPWLATSFKASDGGLTVTIGLRHGVNFQDGTAFNAAAVKWNLMNYSSTTIDSECVTYYATLIKSIATPNNYTVVLTLNGPDGGLQSYMTTLDCGDMVSPTAYQADGPANFANNPVGTGPYKYSGGTPTETAVFTRWKGYWGEKPHLASITFTAESNSTSAFDELENGSAQVWFTMTPDQLANVKSDKHLVILKAPAASINYVTFSVTHPPFNNVLAREAVFYATDSTAIRKELYQNFYPAAQGVLPSSMGAYTTGTIKGYPSYDPTKAQALVQQLGGLKFSLNVTNVTTTIVEAEALQSAWEAVGMQVTINPLQTTAFLGALHAHTFDTLLVSSIAYSDPDPLMYRFFYSGSPLSQLGLLNGTTSLDSTLDQEILQGRAIYGTHDRSVIYKEANQRVETTDFEWDDIYSVTTVNAQSKKVLNLAPSAFGKYDWANVQLSK